MLSKKPTPFDRKRDEKPLMKMLIHIDSFVDEIMSDEKTITSLLKLSTFPILQIVVMPTNNPRIIDYLRKISIELSTYEFREDFISLNNKDFSTIVLMGKHENLDVPIIDGSLINKLDFFAGRDEDFDYFVTNVKDSFFSSKLKKDRDICPKSAIELIRILLVNSGYFFIKPNLSVNEGYYYLFRFKKLFHEYQFAWSVVVGTYGKSMPEEIFSQFDSLSTRLELLCRAADKTSYYALKWPNNDTQDNTLYHFGYLIMLITGVFDDLAWIINGLYNLRLDKRDVVIKIPPNKVSTKFYNSLKPVNNDLFNYLTHEETQKKILLFYPIRDSLQHRQFMKGIRYSNKSQDCEKNLFRISNEAAMTIKNVSMDDGRDYGIELVLEEQSYIDAHKFTMKALEIISQIVNNTMNYIDWDQYAMVLSDEQRDNLYMSKNLFNSGLGKFLGWEAEPLYF